MMNILYLGKFFPEKLLNVILDHKEKNIGFSNHNFEMSVINGLCRQEHIDFKCITLPAVFSFPHNNHKFFTRAEHYKYKNTEINSAGFCNLVLLKEIWSTISCMKQIIKCVRKFHGDTIHIIINTPDNRLFTALKIASWFSSKHFSKTVIIPDIPSLVTDMDKHNPIKRILLKYRNDFVMKITSNSNGLVLLTEAMMDFISKPVKHIVMEGIVDTETMNIQYVRHSEDKKIILYTGTLRKIFGVMNLVEAFKLIPRNDVELWICGSGDSQKFIENAARDDSRIKFWGLVDSKAALTMQYHSTVLVNPRTSEGVFTKYSFPSKTMEYLLAGRSVIINKLPGIPDEYYDYVYTPIDESITALADCISYVLSIPDDIRERFAAKGRKFILEKKNSKMQTTRILDMINTY